MAAKDRPSKCVYYSKGYCLYCKDEPVKECEKLCSWYRRKVYEENSKGGK